MGKVLLLVAAMAGCGSCATNDRVDHVQAPADERLRSLVESAAKAWTDAGCPIFVGAEGALIRYVPTEQVPCDHERCAGHWDGDTVWIGLTEIIAGGIETRDRNDGELSIVTRHELGHMLGFGHRKYGIMQPSALWDTVTPADCDESLHR